MLLCHMSTVIKQIKRSVVLGQMVRRHDAALLDWLLEAEGLDGRDVGEFVQRLLPIGRERDERGWSRSRVDAVCRRYGIDTDSLYLSPSVRGRVAFYGEPDTEDYGAGSVRMAAEVVRSRVKDGGLSLRQLASGAAGTARAVLASSRGSISEQTVAERRLICVGSESRGIAPCEHASPSPSDSRGLSFCAECGCSLRTKTLDPKSRCPVGRW